MKPSAPYAHGSASRTGVLLVNLGTPAAPSAAAVKPYLREFLSDRRVVELPRLLWWPILHLFVLTTRPARSAAKYAAIWTAEGSPLAVHSARQATLLRGYLGSRVREPLLVEHAMRYGRPAIGEVVERMHAAGCRRLLVLPAYPQYSASTTASVFDAVSGALRRLRDVPALRTVRSFHDHPAYIRALAASVRDYWAKNGRPATLLMSFHGVPRRTLERGDPYHCECHKTGRLLAEELGLAADHWRLSFQSRFGRAEWLRPYTTEVLGELGRARAGRVDVVCPGFVADCLETLEEIALEGRATFLGAGGAEFHYIPALNERHEWIDALAALAVENLGGWFDPHWDAAAARRAATATRERALALGATD